MDDSDSTPTRRDVRRAPPAVAGCRWDIVGLIALGFLTLAFQAGYIFLPTAAVLRPDGFDTVAHFAYFRWISQHPARPFAFRGSYAWVHVPFFYQWNAFVTDLVCRSGAETCANLGLKVAWFLQAVLRMGALAVLLATYRRLFRSANVAIAALVLCATSPRVFFATCIWNQDDYVFFFAVVMMYVTVASIRDGVTTRRLVTAALAAALGLHFKLTTALPTAAMLFTVLLLPARRASVACKAAVFGLVVAASVALNWTLLTTPEGRAHMTWTPSSLYESDRRNSQNLLGAYLTVNVGPLLHPEPAYVPVAPGDWTGRNSTATLAFLNLFELHGHFQGPPRTWLNLFCVWTGAPLLALVLWRAGRALLGLLHPATLALDEVYCATLVALSFAALFWFSLGLPFGWSTHPEYVLAGYPAAGALLFRQGLGGRSPAFVRSFAVLVTLHVTANLALLVHTAHYKIALSL
jgi:hypothetical protein